MLENLESRVKELRPGIVLTKAKSSRVLNILKNLKHSMSLKETLKNPENNLDI